MKKPDSVDAALFKRAELVKHTNDRFGSGVQRIDRDSGNITGYNDVGDEARRRSFELACADRWALIEIIVGLEEQLDGAKAAGFQDGYEQRYNDMVDDGWREPRG